MRKKFVQFVALLLAISLVPVIRVQAATVDPTIRVGLFYDASALSGANLLNSVGSGYRLGYYDSSRAFVQLASTTKTAISIVKTQNVYYGKVGDWNGYYDSITSSISVGCYHIQLPGSYSDLVSAQAAASAVSGAFPAWIDGTYYVRVGAYLNRDSAQAAMDALGVSGAVLKGTSSYGVSVVETGTSTVLFQFDSTGNSLCLGVKPGLDDSVKTETIFRGNTYYGGFQYQRVAGGNLTVSNVLPMEDYIQGVVVREMSPSWPLEALKAQAVCARTYAYRAYQSGKHSSQGFDICNTTDCQVYSGIATISDTSRRAVEETAGQYIYYNGQLAETFYFSCDGGATESSENVWTTALPYLVGKVDPYEPSVADKTGKYNWTVTYTAQQLTDLLNSKGYANAGIVDMYVAETTPTGNVKTLAFTDSAGQNITFTKQSARTFLGLNSIRYTISGGNGSSTSGGTYSVTGGGTLDGLNGTWTISGDGSLTQIGTGSVYAITGNGVEQVKTQAGTNMGSDTFVITGSGWGHNVGMSQWGAYAMAQQGFTYQDILKFYFTGVEIHS